MSGETEDLSERELLEKLVNGFENFTEDYRHLRKFVYGNGEPGLAGEMRTLKARVDGLYSTMARFATPVAITLLLSILGFIWAVITHNVTIVPASP